MLRRLCLLFIGILFPLFTFADNLPRPEGWVSDFAGVISAEYKAKLNSLIGELEEKTSTEIAVVTVDSIAPYDEKEYARLLFDNWRPGKKGKDNGVLVLLAVKERRWRIETGYGIEGILPDGLCGEIGRNYMAPHFEQGKYAEGLYNGVIKIAEVISRKEAVKSGQKAFDYDSTIFVLFLIFLLGPFLLGIIFKDKIRKSKFGRTYDDCGVYHGGYSSGNWDGGGFGGGFGGGGFGGFGGGSGGGGGAGGRF